MNCFDLNCCTVCPRECGADRYKKKGVCGVGAEVRVAKTMLHKFEEPCISGCDPDRGSGAIFFAGCSLKCVFCQNKAISRGECGEAFTVSQLADEMLSLQDMGAHNINLVTPTHYIPQIIESLDIAKPRLSIPVVFNTGGYEKAETIRCLDGYADIFLTDFKYGTSELAKKYSAAENYPEIAASALKEMLAITGAPVFDSDGMMKKGIIIRHLVLPGGRHDSETALRLIADTVTVGDVLLALMRQYTPDFAPTDLKELRRKVTSFEYNYVLDIATSLGFNGFSQYKESAQTIFTPDFN